MNLFYSKKSYTTCLLASLSCLTFLAVLVHKGLLKLPYLSKQPLSFIGQIPLHFEINQGQVANQVQYLSRGDGYNIYFTSTEVVLDLDSASQPVANHKLTQSNIRESATLRLQFVNANARSVMVGKEELPSKSNYFIGNDPTQWHTNIKNYAKVIYQNLYPRIDAIFYGHQKQLEYDIRVAPGAHPETIRFHIEGAKHLHLDPHGNLILTMGNDKWVMMHKPIVYQLIHSIKHSIKGDFALFADNQIGFKIDAYDKTQPLMIDPVLTYSTYLGGSGGSESSLAIAIHVRGFAYVTGSTNSIDFPTQSPIQSANLSKQRTAFVTKINTEGNALVYSTYLGGHGGIDQGFGIAVGRNGVAYITGTTNSNDFPLKNPAQSTKLSPNLSAFVTKINSQGSSLTYSTYLGGSGFYNEGLSIALDNIESAYVTGFTNSNDFPLLNPFQAINKGANITSFVTKIDPLGNTLNYSTYLGGSGGNDRGFGIAVDCFGNAYVTGQTNSKDFPTLNPFQAKPKPIGAALTGFVTKLNTTGNGLVYSTYLGGSGGNDSPNAIALDPTGSAYVTGFTNSKDFPLQNPFQATNRGANFSAFVSKLGFKGNTLVYSTYLGGSGGNDKSFSIAVDDPGNAYVTGQTNSTNFPIQNPIQATNNGPNLTAFITKFDWKGNTLFSTYFGGSGGNEKGTGIVVDNLGNVYVTGQTNSKDFPTKNPFQASNKGNVTAFVAKFSS